MECKYCGKEHSLESYFNENDVIFYYQHENIIQVIDPEESYKILFGDNKELKEDDR